MHIVLSQRMHRNSDYKDVPFERYHFPKRYRNQVHTGDQFIYFQGISGHNVKHRLYFGIGVIGDVSIDPDQPDHYYAELLQATAFREPVPIYTPSASPHYYENVGYEQVRIRPNPAWQNSIRRISPQAFAAIVDAAGSNPVADALQNLAQNEAAQDWLQVLGDLNSRFSQATPTTRPGVTKQFLDRGSAVTRVLKRVLGPTCQVCGELGFVKRSGGRYIEAHHLIQVAQLLPNSLCSDNIILVCPTCHRILHYGSVSCEATDETITIAINDRPPQIIHRNTFAYLATLEDQANATVGA